MFIIVQTVIVAAWIIVNIVGLTNFDLYPFILLNLAFSLQAAYAAPLILLAALCGRPREWQALFGLAEHIKARQSGPGTAADLAFGIAIALSRIDLRGPDPLLSVT